MERTHNYFILRYAPDPQRGEQVNIGLVVDRDPLDIRITNNLRKAIAIDARRETSDILGLEPMIRKWTSTAKDFEAARLALHGFGPILVSELAWFQCSSTQYEASVDRIMQLLVTPPSRPYVRARSRVQTAVRQMFHKGKLLGDAPNDIEHHLVVPNYPISPRENLFADFAMKNGVLHLTQTVDFRVIESIVRRDKFHEVGFKALTFVKSKQLHPRSHRYFIYAADRSQEREIQGHLNLIENYTTHMANFLSKQERLSYYEKILSASGRNEFLSKGAKPQLVYSRDARKVAS